MSSTAYTTEHSISRGRAWTAFALGTVFYGYGFAQRVAPSVMTSELMRDLAVGGAALGGLSAFYFYAYAGLQLPVGLLLDRLGARRLLAAALLLAGLSSIMFGFSETLLGASLARALIGGTVAFAFVGTLTIITCWFPPSRFAVLSGIVMTVGMVGAIAGQAPLRLLVDGVGWRATMVNLGLFGTLLAVLLYLIVPREPARKAAHTTPRRPLTGLKDVVTNPQSWFCAAVGFGAGSSLLAFASMWAVPWLQTVRKLPATEAAGITSAIFLGWAVGAPLLGWLSDHLGRRKPVIVGGLALGLGALCAILFLDLDGRMALLSLFFLNGVGNSAMVVCFGVVREVNRHDNSATALGMMNMCVMASGALLQPLVGWLLDLNWTGTLLDGARFYHSEAYSLAFTTLVATALAGIAAALALRETYCQPLNEPGDATP